MKISQNFEGGNIEVVDADGSGRFRLRIRKDAHSDFCQWFYFRLTGARNQTCQLIIDNAAEVTYPDGFRNYRVAYSYDRRQWHRHDTLLEAGELRIDFTPQQDAVYFAYFAPYSMERHHDLIAHALQSPVCSLRTLGQTVDGQDLDLLQIADPTSTESRRVWLIGRQHPGETMAQWWMEGCLHKLLDESDPVSRALLRSAVFYIVPNMNPDGSRRGHLRTNAAGRNLNREWADPSQAFSPEVFWVKQAMAETGVDFLLDVHGDESLPYCFIAGTEGLADWGGREQARLDFYRNRLASLNPDFQTRHGYPAKKPGTANLTMSTAQTASLHGCLAMTLEMPFKDTQDTPDETFGWSPARCQHLAHSCLQALLDYTLEGYFD